jgi:CRISPR-associated protein Cmr1
MFWGELLPPKDEPKDFELRWSPNSRNEGDENAIGSRLASPLIVKALSLADGSFVPCALWLNRAYPDGSVVLGRNNGGTYTPVPGSDAPFDKIAGATDKLRFTPLAGKATVREAFLTWLAGKPGCIQVAP